MPLTLDENSAAYQIQAFEPGSLQINASIYHASVIISPDWLISDWPPQRLAQLTRQDLEPILALKPQILLIGTGAELEFPVLEVYGDLINAGIGVEIMNTRAACRTYNALTAENRQVIAALIIA